MTAAPAKSEKQKSEDKFKPSDYSCEVILEKTTKEKSEDRSFPTDAFIISYLLEGKKHLDVVRSEKMVNVFDFYYDRYGKDVVQKIEYGHGTIRPNLWGAKPVEKKKRRKG
tara:strand:- start:61 stop:393 length:333 start_codon:yes stop_codon:yes gene_type:complete